MSGNSYLTEAFKELKVLDEEVFDVTDDGIEALSDFQSADKADDTLNVIDAEAETEDELQDSYVGKVIIDCCVCHSKIYKDKDEVVLDETGELANIDEECPFCYSTSGFKVIGQVAEFDADEKETEETDDEAEETETEVETEVEETEDEEEVKESKKKNESLRKTKRRLKESVGINVIDDLIERARLIVDEGKSAEDAIREAIDEGLIYSEDIVALGLHYGVIDDGQIIDDIYETLFDDMYKDVSDYAEEKESGEVDESKKKNESLTKKKSKINESCRKSIKRRITRKDEGYRGSKDVEFVDNGMWSDPDLIYNGYTFNYWDIEDALWRDFLEGTGHKDSEANDPAVEQEFNKYVQDNVTYYLDDVIAGGYFEDDSKSWHDRYKREALTKKKTDDIDAEADNRKELAKKRFKKAIDDADADRDMRKKRARKESCKKSVKESTRKTIRKSLTEGIQVGDLIRIDYMDGEPQYTGKEGTVTKISKDPWGDTAIYGTWGGCSLYPSAGDQYTVLKKTNESKSVKESPRKRTNESNDDKVETYHITNIDWETDGEDVDLPTEFDIKVRYDVDDDIEDVLSDAISDKYGFLHNGFNYDKVSAKSVKEDFKDVTITTDDTHMEMTSDESGKVTVTTEPVRSEDMMGKETIEPLTDEDKIDIEANSEVEDEEDTVDVDIEDVSEDEFNELGESYLKSIYDNVSSYKTTSASSTDRKLKLEGIITFNSGKQKKTTFIFESKDITKRGKARFIGENAQICRGRKAFTVTGTIKGNTFISESLTYNYKAKDAKTGKSERVYGTVKTHK